MLLCDALYWSQPKLVDLATEHGCIKLRSKDSMTKVHRSGYIFYRGQVTDWASWTSNDHSRISERRATMRLKKEGIPDGCQIPGTLMVSQSRCPLFSNFYCMPFRFLRFHSPYWLQIIYPEEKYAEIYTLMCFRVPFAYLDRLANQRLFTEISLHHDSTEFCH